MADMSLTEQLQRFSSGDRAIAEIVLLEVLPKLHDIASRQLNKERYFAPLSPTELISETWIKTLHRGGFKVSDRNHFYAIAARAMRQVLVELARNRLAQIRGSGRTALPLDDLGPGEHPAIANPEQIIEIGLLMDRLEARDPTVAKVVEMHYIVGFTLQEIAEITGLSFRQIRHLWEKGRDWLKDQI